MPIESPGAGADVASMLERHRSALQALQGVVATGIGRRSTHAGTCIQIFVGRDEDVEAAALGARTILGATPYEVIVSGAVTPGQRPG